MQQNPECGQCPVRDSCLAYEESQTRVKKSSGEECSEKDTCTICDASRLDEWDEKHSEVRCAVCLGCIAVLGYLVDAD